MMFSVMLMGVAAVMFFGAVASKSRWACDALGGSGVLAMMLSLGNAALGV